jgi:hypothetical protein
VILGEGGHKPIDQHLSCSNRIHRHYT